MTEQPTHVEVLSRNKVSRSTIFITIVPVSIFSGLAAIALWRFLLFIAYGLLIVFVGGILFLAALAVIEVRRRWIHAPYIVVLERNGMFDTSEQRMFPLELSAPTTTILAEPEQPLDRVKQALDILDANARGVGIHSLAKSYKDARDTYWTEWQIRQLIESHKGVRTP